MTDKIDCKVPQPPKYSKAVPAAINPNCIVVGGPGGNPIIIPPPGGQGHFNTDMLAGFSMSVTRLGTAPPTDLFQVDFNPYADVVVALGIIANALGVPKTSPILLGTIIDELVCTWSYNAVRESDITTQSINVTPDGSDPDPGNPTLTPGQRAFTYSSLTLTNSFSVDILGSDGISNDTDIIPFNFGNLLNIGTSNPSMIFLDPANAQTLFDSLTDSRNVIDNAGEQFNASGGATDYMVISYPKRFGLSAFTKGVFTGGYNRILKTNRAAVDIWTKALQGGEVEIDVPIDNGNGFIEDFYFYQSEWPERSGDQPTIISDI